MCILVNSSKLELKKADENIVCYKMIMIENGEYMTPFQRCRISTFCMRGWKKFRAKGKIEEKKYEYKKGTTVSSGLIHTFEYSVDAKSHLPGFGSSAYEVWMCVIPKGEEYVEGKFLGIPAFASKSIKFVEKCVL